MLRTTVSALVAVLILGVGGCASSGLSLSSSTYSADDFAAAQYATLYDFFQSHSRIRVGDLGSATPLYVRDQSQASTGQYAPAMLYIDEQEIGAPVPRLRQIAPSQVQSLEILRPSEASSRYGGHGRTGVIDLRLKSQEGN